MALQIDGLSIKFPARSGYLLVCRLNAVTVGTAAGFDVDELDDLRLAVTEAATWLLADDDAGGEVELTLTAASGMVRIDGVRSGSQMPARPVGDLTEAILGATVDQYRLFENEVDERRISLTKSSAVDGG